jgi:hypothetical protein
MLSPETVMQMDNGGTVNYASPDYPVSETLEAERQELKRALEMYDVSSFVADPSSAPEQPMSLAIKMLPAMWSRAEAITMFTDDESALARMVLCYGAKFGHLPCSLEDVQSGAVEVKIRFADNVLPSDRAVERAADAADVAAPNPLMLREEYYKKYQKQGADDTEIEQDMIELEAQAAERAAITASAFGGFPPARPSINLPGMAPGVGSNGQSPASSLLSRLGSPGDSNRSQYVSGGGTTGGSAGVSSGGGATSNPIGGGGGKTAPTLG